MVPNQKSIHKSGSRRPFLAPEIFGAAQISSASGVGANDFAKLNKGHGIRDNGERNQGSRKQMILWTSTLFGNRLRSSRAGRTSTRPKAAGGN